MFLAFAAFIIAWPIITTIVFVTSMLLLLTCEREILAAILLIAMGALLYIGFDATATDFNMMTMLKYIAIYIGIGLVFTFVKWYFWAQKMGRKYKTLKKSFELKGTQYGSFAEHWNTNYSKDVMMVKTGLTDAATATVYYEKPALVYYLTNWIINWPFYAMLLAIEDFIVEIVNWFADRVGKTFSNIATKAFNS